MPPLFLFSLLKADKNDKEADRINVKAFEKTAQAEERKIKQENETRNSLEKLANRKKGILLTSMNDFIATYEKIKKIEFQESDGIQELSYWTGLLPELLQDIRSMSTVAGMTMTNSQTIAAFIIGGIPGIIKKESEINLSVASMRRQQANIIESQIETICTALEAIRTRADKTAELLAKLNLLFRKTIDTTAQTIQEKGGNKTLYTRQDKEQIMTCINFATAIKAIIDTKLIDENGEIAIQSTEAIQTGEAYLNRMHHVIGGYK
ncbi:hypothetical protein [Paenibacillus sp. NEAU-GSW1]|uniref:hypothetical protein n=1 Tax=Paenibacillus sp. NEAU-GSW1 TaxID=2682486 RepID=UPI0012E252EE|nr:hypothetical protein [Paenibacillus sp. NEAU-GSW1]MUT64701.1 hypothetical protein [Paenibacillus sp. NEAU-GSW1]